MNEIKEFVTNQHTTQGNVNIKVFNGSKKCNEITTHNTGTVAMCEYLRDALLGANVYGKMPGYIIPCKYVNNTLKEMFTYGIPYVSNGAQIDDTDGNPEAVIKFMIPSTVLTRGVNIAGLKLYSFDTQRTEYATVDIHDNPIEVTGDTNLEVSWTIKISPKKD